jgi:hypothetical protein
MPIIELDQVNSPFAPSVDGTGSQIAHPWDLLTVAGVEWGRSVETPFGRKFEIKGAKRAYKWQIRDGIGLQGSPQTYWGWLAPHTFTITFYMFTQDEYAQWVAFQTLFMYDASPGKQPGGLGGYPKAVSIYHPQLSILNIASVLTEDIGAVEKQSDDKIYTVSVTLREFRNPIPIVPDTADATSTVDPTNRNLDPRAATDQAELAKAAQRNAIANGTAGPSPRRLPKIQSSQGTLTRGGLEF